MERTDQVLARTGVDAGLTADRGVDHAQQRGRHMHDVDSAQPGRGGETCDIGGRSPPRLTIASLRPIPMRPNTSQMNPRTGRSLPFSASGISIRCASIPLSARVFRMASAVCASVGWCRMATLCRPARVRSSSPSRPVPMITGYGRSTSTSTVTGSLMRTRSFLGRQRRGRRGRLGCRGRCQRRRSTTPRWTTATPLLARRLGTLEPVHDVTHDRAGIATVGVHAQRGDLPIQRDTLAHQSFELLAAVAAGQQWAHRGTARAAPPPRR